MVGYFSSVIYTFIIHLINRIFFLGFYIKYCTTIIVFNVEEFSYFIWYLCMRALKTCQKLFPD